MFPGLRRTVLLQPRDHWPEGVEFGEGTRPANSDYILLVRIFADRLRSEVSHWWPMVNHATRLAFSILVFPGPKFQRSEGRVTDGLAGIKRPGPPSQGKKKKKELLSLTVAKERRPNTKACCGMTSALPLLSSHCIR